MNTGNIEYLNLRELANEDYEIIDGEADITGWPVVDEGQNTVGKVRDLLFDLEQNAIRYIITDLENNVSSPPNKAILIPIGIATLGIDKKEVIIPVMDREQYNLMPNYIIGEVTRDTEMKIRSAIGSPAALRIEEEIVEIDHAEFYQHHHFDRGNVISRKQELPTADFVPQLIAEDRKEEENTIHQLIDHARSETKTEQEVNQQAVEDHEGFTVNTSEGTFTIQPQTNGTYRVFEGERKIGVIYAEPGHDGSKWQTMDHLDERLVVNLGDAIADHNTSRSNS
ncbi:PRC-barrel domain-containing protein [Pedobacter frigidisoli]|uniref:PRC-barrel domain-containing protein n=1 Tax=Pedobacter frigidisoli TaxID=2530455 RepID=UPI002931DB64|nr:PRC-barrel domain-containing protein [Pedobacter frigidisoli]